MVGVAGCGLLVGCCLLVVVGVVGGGCCWWWAVNSWVIVVAGLFKSRRNTAAHSGVGPCEPGIHGNIVLSHLLIWRLVNFRLLGSILARTADDVILGCSR